MSSTRVSSSPKDDYRLPKDIKPTHYDITIKTDLEGLTFKGSVKVFVDVEHETSTVVLNSSGLDIRKASVYSNALQKELIPSSQKYDKIQERVTFSLPEQLPCASTAYLKITFSGKLARKSLGYFHSSWIRDGETRNYTMTQFEPTSARRAFPCWDEPALKATFTVNLISRSDTINLSNMPVVSEDICHPEELENNSFLQEDSVVGKWKITRFQPSLRMSSYLVAFANGNFDFLEKEIPMPISGKILPLRVYATPDVIPQAQLALDVKVKVLPLYEELFNVAFPLHKLDTLLANDFQGAMENWGLIIGGHNHMLVDPENDDHVIKSRVTSTQAHEVAHMWFGNITTMEWWSYLYLNEGFATLMADVIMLDKQVFYFLFDSSTLKQYFPIRRISPEWKSSSSFVSRHLNTALALDARPSSHPIEVDVPDANQINQIFDALSYSKAASVLRMLMNYIGEATFMQGVSLYLKKHLYQNTVPADLWESISTVSKIDISSFISSWVSKIGFPVVTVAEVQGGINVRQDRFLETGDGGSKEETLWNIPLSILSEDANGKIFIDSAIVLSERSKFIPIDTSKRFKVNAGSVGVFRVLYTPDRLKKIAAEGGKKESVFSLGDRIGIVQDVMALSRAGMGKLSDAMELVNTWKNETEYLVWDGIALSIELLVSIWWEHPDIVGGLNTFRKALFVPLIDKLRYEIRSSEPIDDAQLRICAITQAAAARDEGVVKELTSRFAYFMKTGDDSKILPDLERVVFTVAVRHGGSEEYEAILKIVKKPKTPSTRISAIFALAASEVPSLVERTFKIMGTDAQDQDVQFFFQGLSDNFQARRALLKYLKDEYDVLYERFEGNYWFKNLIDIALKDISNERDYQETKDFFERQDTSKYNQQLEQTMDRVRTQIAFVERSTDDLSKWLKNWQTAERV